MSHLSFTEVSTGTEQAATVDTHARTPIITIEKSIVEAKADIGDKLDVIIIDVVDGDVKTRFFVDVMLHRGRIVLTAATNVKAKANTDPVKLCNVDTETKTKKLRGEWC